MIPQSVLTIFSTFTLLLTLFPHLSRHNVMAQRNRGRLFASRTAVFTEEKVLSGIAPCAV